MSAPRPVMTDQLDAQRMASRLSEVSAAGIAQTVSSLIADGSLPAGTRLPTIRDLAQAAGVSASVVAEAWRRLRRSGLVETHRRGGTIVVPVEVTEEAGAGRFPGWTQTDLVQCSPDLSLQPPLGEALIASLSTENLNSWGREHMTPRLRAAVEPEWPFEAEAWMTAGGGTEALLLATAAVAHPGSVVAIDQPVVPGFLDTLRDLGLTPVGVENDRSGPLPSSLVAALARRPAAFIVQPGSPFAIDHRLTQGRAQELAEVLLSHPEEVFVVEDDSIGPLAEETPPSLGAYLPTRILRIRSYCKAYGIDLRTSVVGGSRRLVERAVRERSHGVGSNSRILQNALAHLIADEATAVVVEGARRRYASRKRLMLDVLAERGLSARSGPDSIVIWIEVPDETAALLELAQQGIALGSGGRSFVDGRPRGLLRVSVMQLPDDEAEMQSFARIISQAATGSLRDYFD